MRFVDEPTEVEARLGQDGEPTPRAFTWQGRWLTITDWGRRWGEASEDGLVRHFLVMVAGSNRFELTQHVGDGRWRVVRVWQRPSLA